MKTVKITITPQGISIEGQGFSGIECEDVINKVKQTLGLVTLSDTPKPEYFECTNETQLGMTYGNSESNN
jgi:hypothetical protein